MKQIQAIRAYQTLMQMRDMPLSISAAYKITMLLKKLDSIYTSQIDLERGLLAKHNGIVTDDGGVTFTLPNHDEKIELSEEERALLTKHAQDFNEELNELNNQDVELEIQPIKLKFSELEGTKLTIQDMLSLEGFVEFEDE